MLTRIHGRPSSGSQTVASNESTPSTSTSTSSNAPQPPGTEDFHVQLNDYLLQDNFDDGTLYGRISDDPPSPLNLEAAYEARAHVEIEAFNTDFHNNA
jgi:hypothetical protein